MKTPNTALPPDAAEFREHLDVPAIPIYPPNDDGLCHGTIKFKYRAADQYRNRTVVVSECDRCHKMFSELERTETIQ